MVTDAVARSDHPRSYAGPMKLVLVLVLVSLAGSWTGCKEVQKGMEQEVVESLDDTAEVLAADTIKEYEIAKRSGSAMDACLRAGLVAEFYLSAKNEADFKKWTAVKKKDCRRAGL